MHGQYTHLYRINRFWERVHKTDTCWLWTGATARDGYGRLRVLGKEKKAHRFSYEISVGPIPDGLTLDHLCRVRNCVNPAHLEPVSNRENTLRGIGTSAVNSRKTHCKYGHAFTPANTYIEPKSKRRCCQICRKGRRKIWAARSLERRSIRETFEREKDSTYGA